MKFYSEQELFDYLNENGDLYSPSLCTYLFLYNENGAICEYSIDSQEANELNHLSKANHESWSAFLGPGGSIYDDPEGYFENDIEVDDWINTNDYDSTNE